MENRSPNELKSDLKNILEKAKQQKEVSSPSETHSETQQEKLYSPQEKLTQENLPGGFLHQNHLNEESQRKYQQVSGGIHQDVMEYQKIYDQFNDLYRNYTFILEKIQTSTKEIDSYAGAFVSATEEAKEEFLKLPSMITALSNIQKNISGVMQALSSTVETLSSEDFIGIAEVIVEATVRFQNISNEVLRELAVMKAERDEIKDEIKSLRILIEEKLLEKKIDIQGENVEE